MTDIEFENLADFIRERLPALRARLDEEQTHWSTEVVPAHVAFGDILEPYLETAIRRRDAAIIVEIAQLLEEMANHPDKRVPDVVRVSVVEALVCKPELLAVVRHVFGERTKKLIEEVETWEPDLPVG